ncbi:MAG: hypothetical protein K0Q79_680 [Flavipsychrobacter sp.]|jgi:ribosomal protein L11 methyltransferase|nr:hypothetical protein [Flavipsychrobacter sp.]
MQYVKLTFAITGEEQSGILIAMLTEIGYDGFEEAGDTLIAYIAQPNFHEEELQLVTGQLGANYATEIIQEQNWNALWESNFPPVIVEGLCTIRADFHDIKVTTPYDIRITPKMSFGTGHHATTQLMMQLMQQQDMENTSVLDFGTGTGVLAILAEMMGATNILAIDNDDWCVENASENLERNNCRHIRVEKGSLEVAGNDKFQVILANINRHILLQYMQALYDKLGNNGVILMSGLLREDRDIIVNAAETVKFGFEKIKEQGNWIALVFNKHDD